MVHKWTRSSRKHIGTLSLYSNKSGYVAGYGDVVRVPRPPHGAFPGEGLYAGQGGPPY